MIVAWNTSNNDLCILGCLILFLELAKSRNKRFRIVTDRLLNSRHLEKGSWYIFLVELLAEEGAQATFA